MILFLFIKHWLAYLKGRLNIYEGWVIKGDILYKFKDGKLHNIKGPAYISFNITDQWPTQPGPVSIVPTSGASGINSIASGSGVVEGRYYLDGVYYKKEDWEKELLVRKLSGIK